MPANAPITTPTRPGNYMALALAAATIIFQGTLVARDANGNAVPASNTAGLRVIGMATETFDNSAGNAGDVVANVQLGIFQFANSGTSAVTAAMVGKLAIVEDDQTVALTATNKVVAGRILEVNDDGVWIDTRAALFGPKAATGQRLGKFELCDGGTIFLDEIGDMALATQTKILRVLQQGEIQRVGGTETIKVDVRIIAATNKDLEEMVKTKTFREDLYYRLNVVRIKMPALRERVDDVPQILDFCIQNLVKQKKARVNKVSPEALAVLTRYRWPGNVRELENVIYRSAVIAQGDTILLKDLPAEIRDATGVPSPVSSGGAGGTSAPPFEQARTTSSESAALASARVVAESIASGEPALSVERALDFLHAQLSEGEEPIMERLEREMIVRVLKATEGNLLKASEKLGMTRATLRKRVDELGLKP